MSAETFNPQTTILDGKPREWFPAEVLDVDFEGKDKNTLYSLLCRYAGAVGHNKKDVIRARALDANIKNIPIRGEIILVTKAPSPHASAAAISQEYYYSNPVSIQSSVHHNGLPGMTDWLAQTNPTNPEARDAARDGMPQSSQGNITPNYTIDPIFVERSDVYPIQPYSGDIILEGRWGQSIRFGSTIDERRKYPQVPTWKKGLGATGNPILIISNGTNPDKKPRNEFILEEIDKDDSTIWLTSGQYVKFEPASTFTPSITNKSINLFTKNEYGGNAVMIASDRIVFNARKQEIIGFSKEGIGFSSEKGISLDGKQVVEFESEQKISLGLNAVQPVLMGTTTMNWLNDLCQVLMNITKAIQSQTHPTGTGPSGIPINVADFSTAYANLNKLKSSIKDLPSQLVFLNEKPGGPSEGEEANADSVETESRFTRMGDTENVIADPNENILPLHEDALGLVQEVSELEKEKVKIIDDILDETDPKFDYGNSLVPGGDGSGGGPV